MTSNSDCKPKEIRVVVYCGSCKNLLQDKHLKNKGYVIGEHDCPFCKNMLSGQEAVKESHRVASMFK